MGEEEVVEVCKKAEQLLLQGEENSLDLDAGVKHVVFALITLVREGYRAAEVKSQLESIGLKGPVAAALGDCYSRVVADKSSQLDGGDFHHLGRRFHHLEWRLQATLATRSLLSQVEPKVVARLMLEKEEKGELEEQVLELEVDVLKEVVATLEEAAAEANSPVAKKITRR